MKMELKDITINLENGYTFTMKQEEVEHYSAAMCTRLITEEEWEKVAEVVTEELNKYCNPDASDDFEQCFYSELELALLKHSKAFYYGDMWIEDWERFFGIGEPEPDYQ